MRTKCHTGWFAGVVLLLALVVSPLLGGAWAGEPEHTDGTTGATAAYSKEGTNFIDTVPLLRPGLVIQVTVLVAGKKEIDEQNKRVSNSGEVVLPLIGEVNVNGMSLSDVATLLTKQYSAFFINPQVVIEFVMEQGDEKVSPWGYVTVLGRIKAPGRVGIPPTQDLTVSTAIQQAGGLDTSAKDTAIRVTRQRPDGLMEQYEINLKAVGSEGQIRNDLILKPGDIIYVPEMIF